MRALRLPASCMRFLLPAQAYIIWSNCKEGQHGLESKVRRTRCIIRPHVQALELGSNGMMILVIQRDWLLILFLILGGNHLQATNTLVRWLLVSRSKPGMTGTALYLEGISVISLAQHTNFHEL